MTEETLEDAYYRIARESAVWRERAMRLQLSDKERQAVESAADAIAADGRYDAEARTLRGLLARCATH